MPTFNQLKGRQDTADFMQRMKVRMKKDANFRHLVLALHEAATYNSKTSSKDVMNAAQVVRELMDYSYIHEKIFE